VLVAIDHINVIADLGGRGLMSLATFTLSGFDDQEQNLTFVIMGFQVLNSNLMPVILSRLSILFINYYCVTLTIQKYFYRSFSFSTWLSHLHVYALH